jgi:hypothetical protein
LKYHRAQAFEAEKRLNFMQWIAPSEKDTATDTVEKRLWDAADQFRANSGLKPQEYSSPNRFTEDDMMGNGAIFAAVTKEDMQGIELVCPASPLVLAATKHFEPIHFAIVALSRQIQNLRRTRDLLLPRLLSGQVALALALNTNHKEEET